MANESSKEFWKNSHFENMRADFPLRHQNSLRQNTPKMMHFQTWTKNIFTINVPKCCLCCIQMIFWPSFGTIRYQKAQKISYSFTCILPDYVANEITKEFWKNSHFENRRAGFLLRCQNILRYFTPEMIHFQAWKKLIFTNISP